jgi:DNA repair photolyase
MPDYKEKTYKAAVGIRGDMLYCPLSLSIDSYFQCETDCHHCYMRRLNRTWGTDLRPADPKEVRKKLENGLKNKNPRTHLAHALKLKKTIRLGNKTDPYQDAELKHQVTREILKVLIDLEWDFVIQTRFLGNMMRDIDLLEKAGDLNILTVMPIISPGAERDWEILERKRTTPIDERLEIISELIEGYDFYVGVNGEPFIPGFHTLDEFRDMIRRLKEVGVESYNTYNLHFNDHVAKRFCAIGLDIDKIWRLNQDSSWRKIQRKLCEIATEEKITLGCPDFVNTGKDWREGANTCCGITVANPSKFNTHWWKKLMQKGKTPKQILKRTYEGYGDYELAKKILTGKKCDNYTMKDAGLL